MALATLCTELILLIVECMEDIPESCRIEININLDDDYSGTKHMSKKGENAHQRSILWDPRDLNALGRTCRALHKVVNKALYEANRDFQDSSAIFWAARNGRNETLDRALSYGLSIDEGLLQNIFGAEEATENAFFRRHHGYPWRPIQFAAKSNHYHTVEWFLDHGAAIDAPSEIDKDQLKDTLRHRSDHPLGQEDLASLRTRWRNVAKADSSVLFNALRRRDETLSVLLIRRGARLFFAHEGAFGYGLPSDTALHLALREDLRNTATLLVKEFGMNPNLRIGAIDLWTPLEWATTSAANATLIRDLVQLGADANYTSDPRHGSSALHIALQGQNYDNAQALLEHGAQIGEEIVVHFARYCPDGSAAGLKALETLIRDHGVDINAPDTEDERTAFGERACYYGDESLVKFMLKNGADPNKPSGENGDIPLAIVHFKTSHDVYARLVALLLDHGADPECRINKSEETTWLQCVRECRDTEQLEELLKVLRGRNLDLPWKELQARARGPRYSMRAVNTLLWL